MEKEVLLRKLGARVREIRTGKGVSQSVLANTIGKDQQSLQRLETGKINPSLFYLKQLSIGLDITIEELLRDL